MTCSDERVHPRFGALPASERSWSVVAEGVEIWDVEWRPDRDAQTRTLTASCPAIVFLSRGSYRRTAGRRTVHVGSPAVAMVYSPGTEYRVSHPRAQDPVRATRLLLDPACFEALGVSASALMRAMFDGVGGALATSARTSLLQRQALAASVRLDGSATELVVDLIDSILDDAGEQQPLGSSPALIALAMDVQEIINAHWRERLTLSDIAGEVECSVWHLARAFKRVTGMTVHNFLTRVRVLHAVDSIADGARDLTGLAFDCGFSSHSHMTAAVRVHCGATPVTLRELFRTGSR